MVIYVLTNLKHRKREIEQEADGREDRFYLTEQEFEAIFEALDLIEGEF
jgi:hypothetical protein